MSGKSSSGVSRRKFIVGAGASGAIALAGCTKNNAGGETTDGGNGGGGDNSGDQKLSGQVKIAGSSTVFPLAQAMRDKFIQDHQSVNISIKSTGSGGGFANHFCPGKTDFNNASRPIKDEEKSTCQSNDVEPVELKVATDALTVIVSPKNDFLDSMTVDELKQVWQGGSNKATKWSDINSDWPDKEMKLYGPTEASGTFDYMHEAVVGEDTKHRLDHQATEQDRQIIDGVKGDKFALGYLGFAYYSESKDEVKAVGIDNGNGPVKPSLETAKSGKYKPLARPLFTYPKVSALKNKAQVAAFAEFWMKNSTSKKIVADNVGYVPLGDDEQKEQMDKLKQHI
ncbi:PstS family phosphate ABC transporter substrate-binding protein [Haladaptatus sp. DFWS20]|uniref:PstS family phosphate ABC transporter substrate-binding protein n=1 Tax=Haladaptatus sp. DFWS20 TaxID=3403467 RepID=UPI003EB8ED68